MSSKIIRDGALASQPMDWQKVRPSAPVRAVAAMGVEESPQAQIEALLAQKEHECHSRIQQARQAALQEAEAAHRQEHHTRLQQLYLKLAQSAEDIASLRDRCRREAEQDLVRLSLSIARKLLHREVATDPEAMLGLVKAILQKIDCREVHQLRVHPQCVEALSKFLNRGETKRLEVVPDDGLELGAAIFETSRGVLDASIDTQLREIERGFLQRVGGGR
jgi:flagellar assembly protein FliH